MKKYKLHQLFDITEETGQSIKELNVNTCLYAEGISQYRVMNMLTQFSDEFTSLMVSENSNSMEQGIEQGFAELNKQFMQEGGAW